MNRLIKYVNKLNAQSKPSKNIIIKESFTNVVPVREKELLGKLDDLCGQDGYYDWSTYILPNGHFLVPSKLEDAGYTNLSYEHEDFYDALQDIAGNIKDSILDDYCVKVNTTYPYIALPYKLRATPEQIKAIRELLANGDMFNQGDLYVDNIDKLSYSDDILGIRTPDSFIGYNREITSDDEIIKKINRYYTTGVLEECLHSPKTKIMNESLNSLGSGMFITDSPYTMRDIILNKPKAYRILYDANIDSYMFCDASEYIHYNLIKQADKMGYLYKMEDFIDKIGALDNYIEYGEDGDFVDGEDEFDEPEWIDPFLLYMIWVPKGVEESSIDYSPSSDGYGDVLSYKFGEMYLREPDIDLMSNNELLNLLNKVNWDYKDKKNESVSKDTTFEEFDRILRQRFVISDNPPKNEACLINRDGEFVWMSEHSGKYDDVYGDHAVITELMEQEYGIDYKKSNKLMSDNYIRCNMFFPYLNLPKNQPTIRQYWALKDWLETCDEFSDFSGHDGAIIEVGTDNISKSYDFDEYSPEDILKRIKRYYSSGTLYERIVY